MYIIKNAMKNIVRNKGRNLLLGVIILAIIATTVVSLIINNTSSGIIDEYKNRFGSEVAISPDTEKLMALGQNGRKMSQIPPDMYMAFGQSEYLKDSAFSYQLISASDTLEPLDKDAMSGSGIKMQSGSTYENAVSPTMKVIGESDLDKLTEFNEGARKLIDGSMFVNLYECIISSDLAELNSLHVGDHLAVFNAMNPDEGIIELTITGIYQDLTSAYGNMPFQNPYMNRRNEILTSFATLMQTAGADQSTGRSMSGEFILKDPKDLPAFESEIRAKGLPDIFKVTTDEASYNKIVGPVEGLKSITLTFMIVVLILGAIIILLLSTIAIRERKYEIGVLRAMGMEKRKVVFGLLSETLVITALCLILGLGIGVAAAQPVSNVLLQSQVDAAEQSSKASSSGGKVLISGGKNLLGEPDVKALSEMDVGIDGNTIWQIIIISLLLAGAASMAGIRQITKYEPIKILSERN